MSFVFYKVLHFIGIITLFLGFGMMLASVAAGKQKGTPERRNSSILHGVGLLLILLGGFGMAAKAKLGMVPAPEEAMEAASQGLPNWFWVKVGIWAFFGGASALITKKANLGKLWLTIILVLGTISIYLGVAQPF